MKLRMTGRHLKITPALREYVETRFARLDRYGLDVGSLQVVMGVEKLNHTAEVIVVVNGKALQAKTSTREMYATIDDLVDRIDDNDDPGGLDVESAGGRFPLPGSPGDGRVCGLPGALCHDPDGAVPGPGVPKRDGARPGPNPADGADVA